MKWIQPELKKLQSGHGMRDGRTDRWTDGVKPIYPPNNFVVYNNNNQMVNNIFTILGMEKIDAENLFSYLIPAACHHEASIGGLV